MLRSDLTARADKRSINEFMATLLILQGMPRKWPEDGLSGMAAEANHFCGHGLNAGEYSSVEYFAGMRAFVHAVELGSFSRAAVKGLHAAVVPIFTSDQECRMYS